jgi:signal transduction histidine kinase
VKISRKLLWVVGIIQLVGIAFADYKLGLLYATSFFYFIPIIFIGHFLGNKSAVIAAIMAASLWFAADAVYFVSGEMLLAQLIWNSVVRLLVFLTVSLTFGAIRNRSKYLESKNEALEKAGEEILRLSKVKAEFTSMVSHEIRTPMAIIKESIGHVAERIGKADASLAEQKQYLDMAGRNIHRLIDLVNDILDFSKLEEGKAELYLAEVDLLKLITDTIEFHKPLSNLKSVKLVFEPDTIPSGVVCDADAITQVMTNIIGNAIKFTDAGTIVVRASEENGDIKVAVADEGEGIKKSDLDRVFEPFEQIIPESGKKVKGTGLGMAISKRIIENHQGKIWVESDAEKKRGTTFYFTLPANLRADASSK